MRFMMIMFPKVYENANLAGYPTSKIWRQWASTTSNYRKPACCSRSTG